MTDNRKLLGSTKVSTDNKITIIKDAATILKINKGDILAFYQEDGKVYIERG
jgi:DNA-binding LytR/AlgR family response regulator